jgi:hypothetical protein
VAVTLTALRERLKDRLLETGRAEFTCADSGVVESLRQTAYRWGRNHNYTVTVTSKPIEGEPLKRAFTATVIQSED